MDGPARAGDHGSCGELPDIPGLRERWGKDVVHCPYCFGWEIRDQAFGVLATGPNAVGQALLWRQWSSDVTLLLHTTPRPASDPRAQLDARGIMFVEGEMAGLEVGTIGGPASGWPRARWCLEACRSLGRATSRATTPDGARRLHR